MKSYKQRICSAFILLVAALGMGCNNTNFEIGSSYLPSVQDFIMGEIDLQGYKVGSFSLDDRVMRTRLFRTDSILTSRQTIGVFGAQRDEVFGERRTGFFSQYVPQYSLDDEGFGFEPVVDSVLLYVTLLDYSGDTTVKHTYNVYEVVDDTFLTSSVDSLFNSDYRLPDGALGSTPVFTFEYPDYDNQVYLNSAYVRVRVESAGEDLLARLMLKEGADGTQITYDYYPTDRDYDDFVGVFKGLYICPADDVDLTSPNDGATYSFDLSGTGFGFFGRNREEDDLNIIADTLGMTYLFIDADITDAGNMNVTTVERDYSSSQINMSEVSTDFVESSTYTSTIRVEGLGGVATELILEPAMFEEFERVIAEVGDEEYTTIFFNSARLTIYIESADEYDTPLSLNFAEVDELSKLSTRMGLYVNYSSFVDSDYASYMEAAIDYTYASEILYGVISDYDGSLNRSLGCYMMNIPLEMQTMWTDYCEARDEAGGAEFIDWDNQDWNKLYIAFTADNLLSPRYVSLQGEADGVNKTPLRLNVAYTLIKK